MKTGDSTPERLESLYDQKDGNVSAVARALGEPRATVRDRLIRLEIHEPETPLYQNVLEAETTSATAGGDRRGN